MPNTTSAVRLESFPGGATRPVLYINDRPFPGLSYMTYRPDARAIRQFSEAGCPLFFFSVTPDDCMYEFAERVWCGPDDFDYGELDQRLRLFAEQAPDAFFIPRVYMTTPPWWDKQHPEELVRFDDGETVKAHHVPTAKKKTYPSLASEVWRRDTLSNLRRMIRHIEDGPYGDRIAGYHIASQHTEEWFAYWIYQEYMGDYSDPALKAWRKWLRGRYLNNDALRKAWGREDASLDDAPIPTGAERKAHYQAEFREVPAEQPAIDYALFFSDLMVDTMLLYARAAKEEVKEKKVVGAFYGYLLQMAEHAPISGHLSLNRAFSAPDLDFFTSPSAYINPALGTGYAFFMSLPETVRANGKLWFNENDTFTTIMLDRCDMMENNRYNVHNTWESWMIERRELANSLSHGMAMWWFDMTARWYDGEGFMEEIAQSIQFGERLKDKPLESAAEVLLVVDAESMAVQGYRTLLGPCLSNLVVELGHLGAPFDIIETNDLERALQKRHKLILFANLWQADEGKRESIRRCLEKSGATAVWLHAPLAVADTEELNTTHADRAESLTGFRIESMAGDPVWPGLELIKDAPASGVAFAERWRKRVSEMALVDAACPMEISSEAKMMPLVAAPMRVEGGDIVILANAITGQAGLAVKAMKGWTSVYAFAPILAASWLRAIADAAGVHLYLDNGDTVYANTDLICVAANLETGPRVLKLREPGTFRYVFSEESAGRNVSLVKMDLKAKEVRILERLAVS